MSNQRLNLMIKPSRPNIVIELTNICNLHCRYCQRDEDALYHTKAQYFPVDLLGRVIRGAREAFGIVYVSFTGGEVTLHPQFREIIETVAYEGLYCGFVTNGWHFDRVYPMLLANREAVKLISFSLDGATKEAHDKWRGAGSFVRVIRAITRCYMADIPFRIKMTLRRDTVPQLEQIALLSARLGAASLHFGHFLPTSHLDKNELSLNLEEQREAEQEIESLARILRMEIGIAAGFFNTNPSPPCAPLLGTSCNVDYQGRLTLCCNLSGYRGGNSDMDVAADLTSEDFVTAYERLRLIAQQQTAKRAEALAAFAARGVEPDLYTGSPCLFCAQSFDKIPWYSNSLNATARSLTVLAQPKTHSPESA
jgi:MoaA/NifB/PqqE/SkfB family radical SAM enzyme